MNIIAHPIVCDVYSNRSVSGNLFVGAYIMCSNGPENPYFLVKKVAKKLLLTENYFLFTNVLGGGGPPPPPVTPSGGN